MKRFLCCGILSAALVAACVYHRGNELVYSFYSGGWSYGPSFAIGSYPHYVGFGLSRRVGFPGNWVKEQDVLTNTDFYAGSHRLSLKGDYYTWGIRLMRCALVAGIALFFWIVTGPRGHPKNHIESS